MSVMIELLLLLSVLLTWCVVIGESALIGPPKRIWALVGDDVILPCRLELSVSKQLPTVEWSKDGPKHNVVFLYRDGCETFEMKDPAYEHRSGLFMKELINRNVSLRITNVRLADTGIYRCTVIHSKEKKATETLELIVGAVSEPKAWTVAADGGGLAVHCEVECCMLECQMAFVDHRGNDIAAQIPKRDPNSSGCYTLRNSVTVQDHTDRMTCTVHQPEINQTRHSEIQIAAGCMTSYTPMVVITAGVTALSLLALSGLAYGLWKKCSKSEGGAKAPLARLSSDQSSASLLPCNGPNEKENGAYELLGRKVDELESKLREKDEIIQRQQDELQRRDQDKFGRLALQHGQTTIDCSPTSGDTSPHLPKCSHTIPFTLPADHRPKHSVDVHETMNLPADHVSNTSNRALDPKPKDSLTSDNYPNSCNSAHDPNPAAASTFGSHPQPASLTRKKALKDIAKQHSFSMPVCNVSHIIRHNSCPAILPGAAASSGPSASGRRNVRALPSTLVSESVALSHPNALVNLPRRYSLVSGNRYGVLANLDEES